MSDNTSRKTARKVPGTTAVKKTVAKKAAVKKSAVKKTAAKKVATKKSAVRKAPARKTATKRQPATTTVIAKVDAGFGNHLSIRGSGSGLAWDAGVVMTNTGADEWIWQSETVTGELEFKVLLNDEIWSSGPNGVVFPGATVVFQPEF